MSRVKKQWKVNRALLKNDLRLIMNPAVAMAILKTYVAQKHRTHIFKFWEMLGKFPAAHQHYNEHLMGKMLTGSDDLWGTMFFIDKELVSRHVRKVPEQLALGDAFAVAKQHLDSITNNT